MCCSWLCSSCAVNCSTTGDLVIFFCIFFVVFVLFFCLLDVQWNLIDFELFLFKNFFSLTFFHVLIWKIATLKKTLQDFFTKNPERSVDFTRIVNKRHFDRLTSFLQPQNVRKTIVHGGDYNENTLYALLWIRFSFNTFFRFLLIGKKHTDCVIVDKNLYADFSHQLSCSIQIWIPKLWRRRYLVLYFQS